MSIKQRTKSLSSRHSELADTFIQLKVLNTTPPDGQGLPLFTSKIQEQGYPDLSPAKLEIFQVNIGKTLQSILRSLSC